MSLARVLSTLFQPPVTAALDPDRAAVFLVVLARHAAGRLQWRAVEGYGSAPRTQEKQRKEV